MQRLNLDILRAYLLIVLALTLCSFVQCYNKLNICVVKSFHTGKIIDNNCRQIKNDNIVCVIANDRIECLRLLAHGKADFAVFEPEDLFASQSFSEAHVLITHELRLFQNDTSNYEMVALVSNNVQGFSDLQGKTLCHPGFDTVDNDWTPIFSNYFQNQILPKKCEQSETLLENKISALSGFFKLACIPGVWSSMYDQTIDKRLKSKYENLCALCDNPTACYINDKYHGREGALLCLTENGGDIAWVRLEDARQHFKGEKIDISRYKFLCPDGTVRPMNWWARPCTWITRPWPVIGARSDVAERVATVVDTLNDPKMPWQSLLLQLLEAYRATVIRTDSLKTPEDFLHQFPGLSSAYARSRCYPSRTVKWCLPSNLEDRKCQWLREAAYSYGLEPGIACLQQAGRDACLEAVSKGSCDFYVVQPEELMTAKKHNLTTALEQVAPYPKNFNNIGIFVRKNSQYKKIEDLKGASACFTKMRSVGWNAFVAVMSNRTDDKTWKCSDEKAMSSFFRASTFPGDDEDEENRITSTYDCVLSGRGDVAFVTVEDKFNHNSQLRRICVDDSSDSDCVLTWSTLGSVVINENTPPVRRREIVSLLEELDTWFGTHYPAPTPAIALYSPYDTHRNVIFSGNTVNLQQDMSYLKLPRFYPEILKQIENNKMQSTCGATSLNSYIASILLITTSLLKYFN